MEEMSHPNLNDEELKQKQMEIEEELEKIKKHNFIVSTQWKKWANSIRQAKTNQVNDVRGPLRALLIA